MQEHWNRLIDGWSVDLSLPLYVRKSANHRGSVISHPSGRRIVPTDNSPAQWAFAQAVLGKQPSLEDIRRLIEADQVPVAMALKAKERATARYSCTLGDDVSPNAFGWKVAHVDSVGLTSRTSLLNHAEHTLRTHFRKLMAPRNMFAIPLRYAGLGELPEFRDAIRAHYNSALICPNCKSIGTIPIVYGLPDLELAKDEARGDVVLGGCVVGNGSDPRWACRSCGAQW